MRIALQLPTGLHSHAPGSRSVQHWENVAPGMASQSGRSAAAYEEQAAVPAAMGEPTAAARSKNEAREGTWRREYVLHQPLLHRRHGNH